MIRYYSNIAIISFFMVESPNNNFENINNSEQNEVSEFLESINNDLEWISPELQELSLKQIEKYNSSPKETNDEYDLLDSIDAIKNIESMEWLNDWYQEFLNLLKNSNDLDDLYLLIISKKNHIDNYISENWFPINQETLDAFNSQFWIDVESNFKTEIKEESDEEERSLNEEERSLNEEENQKDAIENKSEAREKTQEEINSIVSLADELEEHRWRFLWITYEWKNIFDIIWDLEKSDLNNQEIYVNQLEKLLTQQNLNKILDIIQEIDAENPTNKESLYSKFTTKLIEYNNSFYSKIAIYEWVEEKEEPKPTLTPSETARIYWALDTENPTIEWNIYKNWDIIVDVSKIPPERFLWDENFSIWLDLPIWDFYPAILEFERKKQDIVPKINSIDVLMQNKDYIDDMLDSNLNITQIKTNLKNILNIDTSFINTADDLSKNNLNQLKQNLNQELTVAERDFQNSLRQKINEYRRKIEKKDALARETLDFLRSIGFDQIPQSVTNNVIEQLNSSSGLRTSAWLTENIDFKNGILWTNSDFDENNITSQEKADFAKVFNIMIGWDENWPINIDAILNSRWAPISDYTVFQNHLEQNNLKDVWFANKIMIDNLRKNNSSEEQKN